MIVGCGDLTILLVGLGFHCFLLKCKEKLRHSLGRPSRSDFVQFEFDEYLNFSREWIKEAVRVLKPDGTMYVFMGMKYISYIYNVLEKEIEMYFNSWITWYYTQGIGKTKGYSPRHDDILMFTKDKKRFKFNLDEIRAVSYTHPTLPTICSV